MTREYGNAPSGQSGPRLYLAVLVMMVMFVLYGLFGPQDEPDDALIRFDQYNQQADQAWRVANAR